MTPLDSPNSHKNHAVFAAAALVIFDCDGVLVDSEILSSRLESELLHELGIPLSPEEVLGRYTGLSYASMVRAIEQSHGVELPADFQAVSVARFLRAIETELTTVPGIDAVLRALPAPCCVASSSPPDRIGRSLEVTGLAGHFGDRVYSAQRVTRGKPAPDLFLLAAAECGVDPAHCVVVEDSPFGVQGAVAAGMHAIGFTAASHCRPGLADILKEAGASAIAANSPALGKLLGARG